LNEQTIESHLSTFLGRYTPTIEAQLRESRRRLRARFPRGFELVFDNYNALVFGIAPTDRAPDSFVSIAGYPKWVTLFFLHGTSLPNPHALLEGSGKQVRSIRLKEPADIDAPAVSELIRQAARPYRDALLAAPPLSTVVKLTAATRRSRRPAENTSAIASRPSARK